VHAEVWSSQRRTLEVLQLVALGLQQDLPREVATLARLLQGERAACHERARLLTRTRCNVAACCLCGAVRAGGPRASTAAVVLDTLAKFVASEAAARRFRDVRIMVLLAHLLMSFSSAAADALPAGGSSRPDADAAPPFHPRAIAGIFRSEAKTDAADVALPTPLETYQNLCRCIAALIDGNSERRLLFVHS